MQQKEIKVRQCGLSWLKLQNVLLILGSKEGGPPVDKI